MNDVPMLGADPEVFASAGGIIVPAMGLIPGTKLNPHRPHGAPEGYGIQVDNCMLEFNIPPQINASYFARAITRGMNYLRKSMPKGHEVVVKTGHRFRPVQLHHPQAKEIGCEPDHDAYAGGTIRHHAPIPNLWRSCGGHLHLGGTFNCPPFVVALFCDLVLGVRSKFMLSDREDSKERAKWYGQPGIYRPKPYGIEYRTPSNIWLRSSGGRRDVLGNHQDAAYTTARHCFQLMNWLEQTSAADIRGVFKQINWERVRGYMVGEKDGSSSPNLRAQIMGEVNNLGVPF